MTSSGPVTAQIRLPDQSAVRFSGVGVRLGGTQILDDVDFSIARNTTFGIASSDEHALRTISELIAAARKPSSGSVTVIEFDAATQASEIRRRLGYLPFPHVVPPHLRVEEYLESQAAALGVPRERWKSMIDTLLTLAGIAGRQAVATNDLPPENRQLLAVAATLVHDPGIVVLHEPTEGLDIRAASRLWNMLRRLNDVSRTVVVCSRKLSELSANCVSLAIVNDGRVIEHGPPGEVVGRLSGHRRIRARLANGVVRTHTVADVAAQAALLRKLVAAEVELIEFAEVPPELDDLTLPDHGSSHRTSVRSDPQ